MTIYYVPDDFQLPNYLLSQVKGKSKKSIIREPPNKSIIHASSYQEPVSGR